MTSFMASARRLTALATIATLALLASLVLAPPAAAVEDVTPARVAGAERIATAAEIARQAFPDGTPQAVVATASAPWDALAGASLAGALNAAMLLVYPDELPAETVAALEDLEVEAVALVGNEQSVSEAVAIGLEDDGNREVTRIDGQSRYDTAQLVAQATFEFAPGLPEIAGLDTVLLASGEVFADALAASPTAYAGPTPVLYTEPDELRPEPAAFLDEVDVEQVVILGGEAAIDGQVEQAIVDRGVNVVRLAGINRVATSATVAQWSADNLAFDFDDVMLARGDDFPDALTAAQLAGGDRRPLMLSATPTILPPEGQTFFTDRCGSIEVVQAVGGEAAVSTQVLQEAETAAEACAAGENPDPGGDDALPSYAVEPLPLLVTGISELDTIEVADLDGQETLDVAYFDCTLVEVDDDGSARFTDADGDGAADGLGTTAAGVAIITGINNVDVDDTTVVRNAVAEDGRLGAQVSSGAEDCAAIAFFPAGNEVLPVTANGRPTVPYGVTEIVFQQPEQSRGERHVYRVDPPQPLAVSPDDPGTVRVSGRFDDEPISEELDVVLFPCEGTDVRGEGPDRFADTDADGAADGFATTDTNRLAIVGVNGEAVQPTRAVGPIAPEDGRITADIGTSGEPDCTIVVAVLGDGDGEFDVDADGVPVEDYGVAVVEAT